LHLKADVPTDVEAGVIVSAPNQEVLEEQVACPEPSAFAVFGHSASSEHEYRKDDVVNRHDPPDSPPEILFNAFLNVASLACSIKGLGNQKACHGQEYLDCEEKLVNDTRHKGVLLSDFHIFCGH
jgi:hypothetical protein